tara:strand:+ start:366 stop:1235 length:870 start_codon:yes stop_codon:yes gene_type:complete
MKNIKYFFQAIIIYILIFIIKVLGINLSRNIFSFLFKKLGIFFKSKKTIIKNLKYINKNLNDNEIQKIINKMWANYGMTFVEYFYLKKFKNNNNHIQIKGEENLNFSNNNEPVIFISGHFANFELMSMELTKRKVNLATIYRPLNNFFINPIMEYLRKKYICPNQIKKGMSGVKDSIRFLNEGSSIALMVDQRVSEGEILPFFEKNCFTTTLPAQLAIKFNCNIVPIYISRENNKFSMEIYKPIMIKNYKNIMDHTDMKIKISNDINLLLEEMILRDPSQWILTHNRWK